MEENTGDLFNLQQIPFDWRVSRCIWRDEGVSVDGDRGVSLGRDWSLKVEEVMSVCVCRER